MHIITVHFEDENQPTRTIQAEDGDSILEAVLTNDIHLNHNCGGVCACTTCHIYVDSGGDAIEEMSEREEDYVDRATAPRLESRLACQCILLDTEEGEDNHIVITIPDQSGIIGHEH